MCFCVCVEYVNAQEVPTDMKSITDRAAQTLLWTELFRGQLNLGRYRKRACCILLYVSCVYCFSGIKQM